MIGVVRKDAGGAEQLLGEHGAGEQMRPGGAAEGEQLTSAQLARRLEQWRDAGKREARFLIGGADGFDDRARQEADLLLAFGNATWPHLLARAMLAEQLWRATSILANHPYHREG